MELTLDQALQKGIDAHKAGNAPEADRYYTAILKANPKHPDANHNMGVLAVGVGKGEAALPFFKTALEANPNNAQYWLSYIDGLIKLDRMTDAKEVFEQAKSKGAKGDGFDKIEKQINATSKYLNAQDPLQDQIQPLINLYTQGKYQEALEEATRLLNQFPNSFMLYNIIGASNQGLGKLEEAIEAYNKALSIKPDYAEACYNMGTVLQAQGKLEEAIEAYNKALSINPDYADAYYNKGNALKDQGKLGESIEAYNKAISVKPDYADAYTNMGITLQDQGKLGEAIVAYKKAISIKPDYADAYNNMGLTLKDQGKLDEAMVAYNKALSIKPNYAQVYYNMGRILKDQGKLEEAMVAYNKALSIEPSYGSARHMLSTLAGNTTEKAPREYVENLFDGYAKKFEASLVDKLEYKTPKLIKDMIIKSDHNASLGSVLDLGCGTGLFGLEINSYCSKLEGIDVSKKMLKVADRKNVYDKLSQSDIVEYLSSKPLDFDYYVAADVFVYIGNLSELFQLIKSRNRRPGKFIFSTEHTEKDGYHLLETGRYAHSKSYVEGLCQRFDYSISHFFNYNLRKEKGKFIEGGLYILSFTTE